MLATQLLREGVSHWVLCTLLITAAEVVVSHHSMRIVCAWVECVSWAHCSCLLCSYCAGVTHWLPCMASLEA